MKKGFTLIELLAVIVILAIIALIATPIVLNIIEESRESANLRSAEMYLDAVELGMIRRITKESIPNGTYNILESGNVCLEYTDDNCTDELKVEVDGQVPGEGSTITVTNGTITHTSLKYNNKTIAKNKKGELVYKTTPCKYSTDEDGYEMVTCGTESFYIMEETEDTITMLAQYNLEIDTGIWTEADWLPIENPSGIQDEKAKGYIDSSSDRYATLAFDYEAGYSGPYWANLDANGVLLSKYGDSYPAYVYTDKQGNPSSSNDLYKYINSYEDHLIEILQIDSAKATVMSYEQAIDLINNQGNPNWLYTTSYWLGSVLDSYDVYCMRYSGTLESESPEDLVKYGVRPVVTISASEIQQ